MRLAILAFTAVLFVSGQAFALPTVQSKAKTDDDLTVTVRVLDKAIKGDSMSWCEIRVVDPGVQVKWKSGDKLDVWVYEDDLVGDELIWHTQITIGGETQIDETFDCSAKFPGGDAWGALDIYGKATAKKAECGFWCLQDSPSTSAVSVELVEDDAREPDDEMGAAKVIGLGTAADYICRDQDWFSFQVIESSAVTFRTTYTTTVGKLDITLYGPDSGQIATGTDDASGSAIVDKVVQAGTHKVRVSPRSGTDYNFYDIGLTLASTDCTPGQELSEGCGTCGHRTRTCSVEGAWGAWGACQGEGDCVPGSTQQESCGMCGKKTRTCNQACSWFWGGCEGEGVCNPGEKQTQNCTGGKQERSCNGNCQWDGWGECKLDGCTEGAKEACYEGPNGTVGVGVCKAGEKTCHAGVFGACENQVKPGIESCANGLDDDCDGKTDKADTEQCPPDSKAKIGEGCTTNSDCEDGFKCLMPPDYPLFKGGYCSKVDCSADGQCGDGGLCGHALGNDFCLAECDTDPCRSGYVCARYGARKACTPKCKTNSDCIDAATPKCGSTGVCEEGDTPVEPKPEPAPEPTPEPTPEAASETGAPDVIVVSDVKKDGSELPPGAVVVTESSGGCNGGAGGLGPWWLLLPGLALLRRRRG